MEKTFWKSIVDAEFAVPEGHTVTEYLPALMEGLGALDSELRDHLCLEILWTWIAEGRYAPDEVRRILQQMLANLRIGVGEVGGDGVFLRTFSVLIAGAVVSYDAKARVLSASEVREVLEAGLQYLAAEQDLRGYVPVKGWAHSVAHTADLFTALAGHPEVDAAALERVLYAVSEKLLTQTEQALVEKEGYRLGRTVIVLLSRELVPLERVEAWLRSIQGEESRRKAFVAGVDNARYHNTEQFLAALHLMLQYKDVAPGAREALVPAVHRALKSFMPVFV